MALLALEALEFTQIIIYFLLIYTAQFYYKYFTRINPLPGQIPLPLLGNLLGILFQANGEIAEWLKILNKKHGDVFETYVGNNRRVVFAKAEYVEKMMSPSTNSNYIIRSDDYPSFEELGIKGKGILLNNNIRTWKYNRKFLTQAILAPSFSIEVLHWTPILFNELNGYWKEIGENSPIDFSVWIHRFTTEIVFQMTIGLKVNSMAAYFNKVEPSKRKHIKPNIEIEDIENFADDVEKGFDNLMFALTYPTFIRHTIFKKRNQEMLSHKRDINETITTIIDHRRNEIEKTPVEEKLRHDMITSLITANTDRDINESKYMDEDHSKPIKNEEIGQILFEAFAGGIDTTANLLCYIIYYLCHYPDVLARLQKEIDSIFGLDQRIPTMEDLSKMHYTEAIFKECSRLINTVKYTSRVSSSSDVVAGYEWPANTTFIAYFEGIHFNSDHWKNPHEFNPDRFIGTDPQKNTFLMFGGGVRVCPGRKLALVEMKCLISLIYRNLDITLVDMNAPLKLKYTMVNTCTELPIRVKQRTKS
ncbi:19649_t:CDS:1 [Funneliformis geosporum]|uniref:11547_t:CDS:1 n=1 Tax=Funneliformis geosporum TaxID=1117311 RepID=A0A9W4SJ84_9GLOM|nr:19649_t:CDS:1 [Funneliformis geosporum]CAI2171073.1 11547_t:CDS:1 [Funneliformis geosporum]